MSDIVEDRRKTLKKEEKNNNGKTHTTAIFFYIEKIIFCPKKYLENLYYIVSFALYK